MTHSSRGKYRNTSGALTVGGGSLVFTRLDGIVSRRERVIVTIPTHAIVSVNVEGLVGKKLVVFVDGAKVPGIPRHEFQVPDPHKWRQAIQREMSTGGPSPPPRSEPAKQVYVKEITREIVKVPCKYCNALNEMTEKRCSSCGAPQNLG